jgi:hypothetical protein
MSNDLERLLRDDAARWRATLPVEPDPATVLRRGQSKSLPVRRWAAVAGSAAAVVLVVGLAIGLHRRASPSGTPTVTSSCQDRFTVLDIMRAADPARRLLITLNYAGERPCSISAYGPSVELRAADGTQIGSASHTTLELRVPGTLLIHTEDRVQVSLQWSAPCESTLPPVGRLVLHMSGNRATAGHGVRAIVPKQYRPACQDGYVDTKHVQGFSSTTLLTTH